MRESVNRERRCGKSRAIIRFPSRRLRSKVLGFDDTTVLDVWLPATHHSALARSLDRRYSLAPAVVSRANLATISENVQRFNIHHIVQRTSEIVRSHCSIVPKAA